MANDYSGMLGASSGGGTEMIEGRGSYGERRLRNKPWNALIVNY